MSVWRVGRRCPNDPPGALRRPKPQKHAAWELGRGALGACAARSETEATKRFARAQRAGCLDITALGCRRPRPSTTSHSDSRTGARVPTPRHVLQPRPERAWRHRLADGVPVCLRSPDRRQPKLMMTELTKTRGRGARVPSLTRPPPAEADEDQAHENARTGCPCAAAHTTAASRS
jgi:hypothetical protein